MKTSSVLTTTALAAAVLLAGCASPDYGYGSAPAYPAASYPAPSYPTASPSYASYGVIDAIEVANAPAPGIGAGTVIGGIVGGILGNQVGGGTGNTVATVAGAVGGAVAGNQIEQRTNRQTAYNVRVRLDNGSYQTVTLSNIADLRVGNRVRIENGQIYRY